jgi:Cof subfamily protein (haloacid dehalogenase superfamily)
MYKMVAIDLDDTLLTDNHEISREDASAISKSLVRGVAVCLVSGRSYSSIKKYVEYLRLRHLAGSLNGAHIIETCSERVLSSCCLDIKLGCEITRIAEEQGIHINFYHGNKIVCKERNQFSDAYARLTGTELEYVGELSRYAASVEAGKLLFLGETEKLEGIRQKLLSSYGGQINATYSKPGFLEIYRRDISKGEAVKKIANYYGFSSGEIVAIGDGENDISMLRCAGVGVAMGNAPLKLYPL